MATSVAWVRAGGEFAACHRPARYVARFIFIINTAVHKWRITILARVVDHASASLRTVLFRCGCLSSFCAWSTTGVALRSIFHPVRKQSDEWLNLGPKA